ncbi:MAG: N-glycosylase/DNA lyase [Thermofilum sp.]|jgi:DNA-(apurinic or apyrimidinic site) lyase|nr:N-glycosylase/DNA lyase [Thermofilum sp.]
MIFFDALRIRELSSSLRQLGKEFYELFIYRDPQYEAVKEILSRMGFLNGSLYIVGVAVVSYVLASKGEDHWKMAADYASGNYESSIMSFVSNSASLRKFRNARLKRIEKYLNGKERILRVLKSSEIDLAEFNEKLAEILDADVNDKTVLFASKMLLYASRASGMKALNFEKLSIPVDYRVSLVSITSGIAKGWGCNENLRSLADALRSKYKNEVQEAWGRVGRLSGIPPLLLDTPIWLVGGCIDKMDFVPQRIETCIQENLSPSPRALSILKEFWHELEKCGTYTH